MAQIIKNWSWWFPHGEKQLHTLRITIKCSNAHDARFVLNEWECHQGTNFYKQNCYFFKDFKIHDATEVQLINETTIQVIGTEGRSDWLSGFHLLLEGIPFKEALIECKYDKNPSIEDIWHVRKREEITTENVDSVYKFVKVNDSILLY